jgi:uncharacterized SAM-binding protein YcdF (DUF218 family)
VGALPTPGKRGVLLAIAAGLVLLFVIGRAGPALVVSAPLDMPDAIVSLASHEWERLPLTASLAGRYPGATVVLTLPQPATAFNCHDCGGRVGRLARLGVGRERVQVVPLTAGGTHGEALALRGYAIDHQLRRLLLVTSPYHTRRSLATFETVFDGTGIRVGIEPASATSPARPTWWWAAGYDRAYVAYEWAATAYYRFKHGVPLS